jgi:hypothetical protein
MGPGIRTLGLSCRCRLAPGALVLLSAGARRGPGGRASRQRRAVKVGQLRPGHNQRPQRDKAPNPPEATSRWGGYTTTTCISPDAPGRFVTLWRVRGPRKGERGRIPSLHCTPFPGTPAPGATPGASRQPHERTGASRQPHEPTAFTRLGPHPAAQQLLQRRQVRLVGAR